MLTGLNAFASEVTTQVNSLVSGDFGTLIATIVSLIALFSVVVAYIIKAINK